MEKCRWALATLEEQDYHDNEWGVPEHNDQKLFEFLILEGAQAGLSWRTILNRRSEYRLAFDNFDPTIIATYSDHKVSKLLNNPGIIRNRLKIHSAIQNARAFLNVQHQFTSFDAYIWTFVNGTPRQNQWLSHEQLPAFSPESEKMSKDLQKRGFNFVGKTICYAYMQAIGMVNDHTTNCYRHQQVQQP